MHGMFSDSYVTWLYNYMRIFDHPGCAYILDILLSIPFRYLIILDRNTEFYGLELRNQFTSATGEQATFVDCPCSLLEALIAIAQRIQWNIFWDPDEDRAYQWFWVMIDNLGLTDCTDVDQISVICNRLLDRTYNPDGLGALCGQIPNSTVDIREVPFYAQCEQWIVRNCFSENTMEVYQ